MEIKSVIVNDQSNMSAAEVMSSKILRQAEKTKALEWWPPKDEFDSPRQRPSADPTPQIKERLVFSIKRQDGSDVLSIYAKLG